MTEFESFVIITSFAIVAVILATIHIVVAVFTMKLFDKARVPTWKAWIPFANMWKFMELGGYPGAISLLNLIGVVMLAAYLAFINLYQIASSMSLVLPADFGFLNNDLGAILSRTWLSYLVIGLLVILCTVSMVPAADQIGRKLGKSSSWLVLFIFAAIVWLGIMAFNKSVWNDSLGRPARGQERPPTWPAHGGPEAYPSRGVGTYPPPDNQLSTSGQPYLQTPYTASQPSVQAPGTAGQPVIPPPAQKTNNLAVAALVCGLAGIFLGVPAIPAVICGAMALRKPHGRAMAIAGLILGIVVLVFWIYIGYLLLEYLLGW